MKNKVIECFVPALALEHLSNGEKFNKMDKIRAAVRRYDQNDDFFGNIQIIDLIPYIVLEKVEFKPKELGYLVVAKFLI